VILNSSRLLNLDSLSGLAAGAAKTFNSLDDAHAFNDFAENDVFSIEPARDDLSLAHIQTMRRGSVVEGRDVKRRAVRMGGGIQW
jgi:hypothetical protein